MLGSIRSCWSPPPLAPQFTFWHRL
ncbi:hypothetical protein HaLaN_21984, partial [Haematococcus lacustris]